MSEIQAQQANGFGRYLEKIQVNRSHPYFCLLLFHGKIMCFLNTYKAYV